ncbi:telomeric repeat-binding factor 1 [Ictalurus furcatus]|uniref:telomeric repeat-binding factor 1 n=1 Tax=Ictalurus furcatus TaxID=66913 RepID=UPI0023508410|nr:telomeric repeat-binding factor 1 [Ictalurus furcatus]XP_053468208.1 telomeric repeat-binding factor 1 [Ictalurus furcatus]
MEENQEVISSTTSARVNICEVESVAKSWMIDFSFLSLCRYYKEQNVEKFSKTLKVFEAMIDDEYQLQDNQQTKRTICCLLSRIMDGKNLDVHYDLNNIVTPLMSALSVWDCLKDTANDDALYDNIKNLLFIQCVGVCLEKGNAQLAAHTLQWLEKESDIPQKLQRKLSTVVSKKDVYNQLLTRFSFNHLQKSVNSFLDAFIEKHPSDFLFKAASKVVQVRQERPEQADVDQNNEELEPDSPVKPEINAVSSELNLRPKKKLFSNKTLHPWKPESTKKLQCLPHRTDKLKVSRRSCKVPPPSQKNNISKYRSKKMWISEEDQYLKAGVKKYGEGKWSKILEEFDFGDRTSVMLKDRWRTLKKQMKV